MLQTRILTAIILIPLVLAALFMLPPRGFGVVVLAVMLLGAHEWAKLVGFQQRRWLLFVGGMFLLGFNLLFAGPSGFERGWPDAVVLAVCGTAVAFWVLIAPAWVALRWPLRSQLAMALVGWVILLGAFVALVELQAYSPWLLLAALAIVWIADTAAYFTGRKFGRRKLAPAISPGKSWEGVYGALAAVALYALCLLPLAGAAGFRGTTGAGGVVVWVVFVMMVTALSIVGDLYESWMKRSAGVKDSGTILPGHGGVLDRIDALLAAMPLIALGALVWLARPA